MRVRHVVAVLSLLTFFTAGVSAVQQDTRIDGDDQTRTIDCKNNAVYVSGDDNTLTLRGECRQLVLSGDDNTVNANALVEILISGDDNTVVVGSVGKITASGDDNTVLWRSGRAGKPPEVVTSGDGNTTRQAEK